MVMFAKDFLKNDIRQTLSPHMLPSKKKRTKKMSECNVCVAYSRNSPLKYALECLFMARLMTSALWCWHYC